MGSPVYSPSQLFRAMAPIELMLESFRRYKLENKKSDDEDDDSKIWLNEEAQNDFARLLKNAMGIFYTSSTNYIEVMPSDRYIRKVLSKFVAKIETHSHILESDHLSELIMEFQLKSVANRDEFPDPNQCCHVSFEVPILKNTNNHESRVIVAIKVFPHHNDVGVQKVWEAGATLAEFFLAHPSFIQDKSIIELGAGVGLTGIIISGLCRPKRVHMTDYTDATLMNIEYNISINQYWIQKARQDLKFNEIHFLTSGYLEWEQHQFHIDYSDHYDHDDINMSNSIHVNYQQSLQLARSSDVMIAADVVYDRCVIPALISVVRRHLCHPTKLAIFATTLRNADTFTIFENSLRSKGISVTYACSEDLNKMPTFFPCYFSQPRSDVRISIMTFKQ